MVSKEQLESYWKETRNNMLLILFIWAIVSYVASLFASSLNNIIVFGFPLGYYMGSQGSLIVFVLLNLYNSIYQDRLDKKYGFEED